MPGTVLSALYSFYVIITALWGRYFYAHFMDVQSGRWLGLSSAVQWVSVWLQCLCFFLYITLSYWWS